MAQHRQLQRSRDALVGGVCGGIARRLSIDPVVVRILAVLLTLATCGLAALVYAILWAALPLEPKKLDPLEVEPREVHSETYGAMDFESLRGRRVAPRPPSGPRGVVTSRSRAPFVSTGHRPPEPPFAARLHAAGEEAATPAGADTDAVTAAPDGADAFAPGAATERHVAATATSSDAAAEVAAAVGASAGSSDVVDGPESAPRSEACATQPAASLVDNDGAAVAAGAPCHGRRGRGGGRGRGGACASDDPHAEMHAAARRAQAARRERALLLVEPSSIHIAAGLLAGGLVVFAVVSAIVASAVDEVSWWMCWPLLLVIFGITRMVVPAHAGWRMNGFTVGVVLFSVGLVMLPMSLGIIAWRTAGVMLARLWPVLLVSVVLFAAGGAARAPMLKLAGALAFVVFCLAGLATCAVPGSDPDLSVEVPSGREYRILDLDEEAQA